MDYQKPISNRRTLTSFLLLFILTNCFVSAQSEKFKELIKKDYDFSKIGAMHVDLEFDFEKNRAKTLALAKSKNWKVKEVLPNGKKIELQEVGEDGTPIYYETYSDDASQASRASALHINGILDLDLDGTGMEIGVWDAGVALTTHQEYDSRAIIADGSTEVDPHATLVTGSLISSGIKREAQGVAFGAKVLTHDWTRDKIEVTEAVANGLMLSNHSYGIKTDRVPDWYFGSYIKVAQDWDRIMYNAPYYLMVTAAGNSRNRGDNDSPIFGVNADGFDLLLGFTVAKNGLTVAGAHTKVNNKGDLKEATVSPYSSYGPVDDGRIKPDLAGDGSSILSTYSSNNESYNVSSGTSMATPGVTGALLLLQQYNEQLYGSYLKAATLKGLALHTADDIDKVGPDYKMGWGVMNAKRAAEVLLSKEYSTQIREEQLEEGESFSFTVESNGTETLMASLSWTDPESEFLNRGTLNDKTVALVNDLDIRIEQNGKEYLPWKLDPENSTAAAIKGDNLVDPYERVEIPNAKGTYTVTVHHKGSLKNNVQDFSVLVSGIRMNQCSLSAPEMLQLSNPLETGLTLSWDAIADGLFEIQYREAGNDTWTTDYSTENSIALSTLENDKDYIVRLRTFCSENIASEYTFEYRFTFLGKETNVGVLDTYETLGQTTGIHFSVYPNPAVDQIHMNAQVSDMAMYSIISTAGVEIKTGAAMDAKIDVSDLATGIYVLQVQDLDGLKSAKFYKN